VPGMAYKTLLQLCHRVREPVSRVLHTFVDLTMEWGETNEDAITSKCIDQHAAQGRILFKTDGSGYKGVIKCVPRHYEWFVGGVRTEVARNKLCHDRYMSFAGEFASKGIRVTTPGYVLGEDAAAELRAQTNATIKQVKDDDIQAVVDAEDITASEALAIREDHSSTPEDRLKARRAGIRDFYERTPTEDIVREELKTQPRSRKLRRLVAHAQVLARSAEMHKEVIEASKDGKPHPGLTERFLAPQITWLILRIAGVDLSQGMEELAPGAEMSKAEIKAVIEGLLGGSNTSRIKEYYTDSGGLEREWTSESLKEGGLFGLIQALAPILPQRLQPGKDFADKPCKYIGGILRGMGLKLKCTRRRGEARRYSIDWETKAVMLAGPLAMRCGLQDHLLRAVAA